LRDERDGPRRARIRLEDVELVARKRELEVQETAGSERARNSRRGVADLLRAPHGQARRGEHEGGVAGMASRSLDVLEDRGDPGVLSVAEHVHVELDRVLEKPVDET